LDQSELVKRCQTGDKNAFEELYHSTCHQALKTAYLISGRRGVAEDIVQEAFIQCYKEIKRLKEPNAFYAWFYKILIRCSWRMLSKNKALASCCSVSANTVMDLNFCLDDMIETQEIYDQVRLAMEQLTIPLRTVVNVDTFSQLRGRIEKAFEDDKALESLKVYDAHRYSGACYHKGNNIIGIYVMSRTYKIIHNIRERVTFRGSKGFWLEHPRHQYFKDKQKEAENLQVRHSLYWVKNGRGFYLRPEGEPDLTYNEALRIAIRFSENY
jgi:RNA polymerase sigma factor (sigma-70 family)